MHGRRRRRKLGPAALVGVLTILAAACSSSDPVDTTAAPVTASTPTTSTPQPTTTAPDPSSTTTPAPTTVPPAPTTTTRPLRTEPAPGGVITVGMNIDLEDGGFDIDNVFVPATMNPLLGGGETVDLARLAVAGAFRIDPATGELVPWLLEALPRPDNGGVTVAEDGTVTITYQVREEAVWADGTPVTAADLVFTHELTMRDDLRINQSVAQAHGVVDADSLVADGKTLTLRLAEPGPGYETLFEWIVPAHAVDAATFGEDWNDRLWLTAGPFQFVSYEPAADSSRDPGVVTLVRNDNYWEVDAATGAPLPYLDGIEVHAYFIPKMAPNAGPTLINTGTLDLVTSGMIGQWDAQFLGDDIESEVVIQFDTLFELVFFQFRDSRFEVNPDSLNEHRLYRRAVLSAIDRVALAETVDAPVVTSMLATSMPALESGAWDRYDDPAAAATLVAELGVELGRDFTADPPRTVYVSSSADETRRIGQAAVDQLVAAGFAAEADFDGDFFGTVFPGGLYDLAAIRAFALPGLAGLARTFGFFDPTLPPDERLVDWAGTGAEADRYAAVVAAAAAEVDLTRLAELLQEAEAILADQAVLYPLVRRQPLYRAFLPERVQGFVPGRFQGWDTANAAWWWSPQG